MPKPSKNENYSDDNEPNESENTESTDETETMERKKPSFSSSKKKKTKEKQIDSTLNNGSAVVQPKKERTKKQIESFKKAQLKNMEKKQQIKEEKMKNDLIMQKIYKKKLESEIIPKYEKKISKKLEKDILTKLKKKKLEELKKQYNVHTDSDSSDESEEEAPKYIKRKQIIKPPLTKQAPAPVVNPYSKLYQSFF